jgi:hypothetical protein
MDEWCASFVKEEKGRRTIGRTINRLFPRIRRQMPLAAAVLDPELSSRPTEKGTIAQPPRAV